MTIEAATTGHALEWATMRTELWPDGSLQDHREEVAGILASPQDRAMAFVALADTGAVIGFAEASLRRDHVNGCDTSPVAFLEGLYVRASYRRQGIAHYLCSAVEQWGSGLGCLELASDTDWENPDGQAFHAGVGFEETERVIFFRKRIVG